MLTDTSTKKKGLLNTNEITREHLNTRSSIRTKKVAGIRRLLPRRTTLNWQSKEKTNSPRTSVAQTNPTTTHEKHLNRTSTIPTTYKRTTLKEYKVPRSITLPFNLSLRSNLWKLRIGEVRIRIQAMTKELSLSQRTHCVRYVNLKIKENQEVFVTVMTELIVICGINGTYVTKKPESTQSKSTGRVIRANPRCTWTTSNKSTSEQPNLSRSLKSQVRIQTYSRRIQACSGRRSRRKLCNKNTRALIEILHLAPPSRNKKKPKSMSNHRLLMNTSVDGHGKTL